MTRRFLTPLFLLGFLPIISCSSSKSLKKTITQTHYNLTFTPDQSTKKIINNTELTITPIDAKILNKETYDAAYRDGNYEKEFVSIIEEWKNELSKFSKPEKIEIQGNINAFEALSSLERDNKIPQDVSFILKKRIIDNKMGRDGSEIESLTDLGIPSDYNPYRVNKNYFSVFKMNFENKGKEIEKISIKEFQISSNEEQLYPLNFEYFEQNLKDRAESMKNCYRLNMPNELIITPEQRVNKYIAIPAINTDNNSLQAQFIRNGAVTNFNFNVTKKETKKTYSLEEFEFKNEGALLSKTTRVFYVVKYEDNILFPLRTNKVFLTEERKRIPVSVYAISISAINSEILFGTVENFIFSKVSKNRKGVPFKKLKKDKKTGEYVIL
jgi:hypothetical protein